MKNCKNCTSFPKYKKLINFQLLENIFAWNLVCFFFYFQASPVGIFVLKNFLSECSELVSKAGFPRHAWVGFWMLAETFSLFSRLLCFLGCPAVGRQLSSPIRDFKLVCSRHLIQLQPSLVVLGLWWECNGKFLLCLWMWIVYEENDFHFLCKLMCLLALHMWGSIEMPAHFWSHAGNEKSPPVCSSTQKSNEQRLKLGVNKPLMPVVDTSIHMSFSGLWPNSLVLVSCLKSICFSTACDTCVCLAVSVPGMVWVVGMPFSRQRLSLLHPLPSVSMY